MRQRVSRRGVIVGAVASATAFSLRSHAAGNGEVHEVTIKRFRFEPEHLQVRVGDTIRWTNEDIAPHTATANEFGWDTSELVRGESGEITVEPGMELSYFCVFHPHRKGAIEILYLN